MLRRSGPGVTETSYFAHINRSHSKMGGGKRLTPVQIAVMTALHKSGHSNEYICNETGVSGRSVRRWISKFKASPGGDVELQNNPPGRRRKLDERDLRVMRLAVEAEPSITTSQLKERHPGVFDKVIVRTI